MHIQRLRQFIVVAEAGSINRAATMLRMAQPALSRQVHRLEQDVGVTLLRRDRRGVHLTPAGLAVAEGARTVCAQLERMLTRTLEAHVGITGDVRLGVARVALDNTRVMGAIAMVRERLPGVRLDVAEVASPDQPRAVRARELDLAIGLMELDGDARVQREVLFRLRLDCAVLGTSHPLALRGRLSADDLRAYPFLTIRIPLLHGYPALAAALARTRITHVEEHESVDGIYTLVAAGHGWTLGSRQVHSTPPAGTTLVPIEDFAVEQPVSLRLLARNRSRLIANVARLLLEGTDSAAQLQSAVPLGVPLLRSPAKAALALDLGQLETVVIAVEEGSLSAAAARLRLTQSGVSRRVHAVELAVGCRLIERASHGVVATNAGEKLRSEVRELQRMIAGVLARARQAAHGMAGECRIGTLPIEITGSFQVTALRRVFEENPSIRIEVMEMFPEQQMRQLLDHRIDIGISTTFAGAHQHPALASVTLVDDVIDCAILAEDHHLASRTWLTAEDLTDEPFMFIERARAPRIHDAFYGVLAGIGLTPNQSATHSGPHAIWRALRAGKGWTLATRSQRARPPAGLAAVPVEGLAAPWGVALLWRRGEQDPTVRGVLDVFRTTRHTDMAVVVATVRARSAAHSAT